MGYAVGSGENPSDSLVYLGRAHIDSLVQYYFMSELHSPEGVQKTCVRKSDLFLSGYLY